MADKSFAEKILAPVENLRSNFGIEVSAGVLIALFGLILFFVYSVAPSVIETTFRVIWFFTPVWLTLLLAFLSAHVWITYRRAVFIASQEHILLEIRIPKEIKKSPLAMEAVLAGIHFGPGEATWYYRYIRGKVRPWWSLEIVSFGGDVRFFIWTRSAFRKLIESQLYAQYPGVQVVDADDYTRFHKCTPEQYEIWGCDFALTKEDPYPIKTYVDYGLDRAGTKEEEKIDPMANLIEFMGSLNPGEMMWLQILVRVTKKEKFGDKDWKDEGKELVEEIRKKTVSTYIDNDGKEKDGFPNPTKGQMEVMSAIERNIGKLGFDAGIRGIYIAEQGKFNAYNINGLTAIFKQFSSENLNGFKPSGGLTIFQDYPWELFVTRRKNMAREGIVDAYKRRSWFHGPHKQAHFVLSTEELATIYHIPSGVVQTPTLPRIQSATAEAPSNLPT